MNTVKQWLMRLSSSESDMWVDSAGTEFYEHGLQTCTPLCNNIQPMLAILSNNFIVLTVTI